MGVHLWVRPLALLWLVAVSLPTPDDNLEVKWVRMSTTWNGWWHQFSLIDHNYLLPFCENWQMNLFLKTRNHVFDWNSLCCIDVTAHFKSSFKTASRIWWSIHFASEYKIDLFPKIFLKFAKVVWKFRKFWQFQEISQRFLRIVKSFLKNYQQSLQLFFYFLMIFINLCLLSVY